MIPKVRLLDRVRRGDALERSSICTALETLVADRDGIAVLIHAFPVADPLNLFFITENDERNSRHDGEGGTPPFPACAQPDAGYPRLFFKLENCNPSGSYKDRFIAAEITRILRTGRRSCVGTSSGNTGSALAAYAARYGIRCVIFVNERTPAGKLTQMRSYGARIVRVRGREDPAITSAICDDLERLSQERSVPLVISAFRYCPDGSAALPRFRRSDGTAVEASDRSRFCAGGRSVLFSAVAKDFVIARAPVGSFTPAARGMLTVAASFSGRDND